ncbi:MAG: hypothetical protein OER04_19685 [Cyclobacteriaceae bacterium]|nr:hypothetical protein [Cyclobacteriaceae bacterium]
MKKITVLMLSLLFLGCEEIAVQPEDPTMAEGLSNFDDALAYESFTTGVLSEEDLDAEKPAGLIKTPANPVPYWARIDRGIPRGIPETKEWGIIYFTVRDVENIPRDFNLLDFFDPRATEADFALKGYTWFLPDHEFPYVLKAKANQSHSSLLDYHRRAGRGGV